VAQVQKVHSLTGRITPAVVYDAWRAVRRNRGAAGIDRVSIRMFEANLDQNLGRLLRELKQGTFEPLPARRVYIPKAPASFGRWASRQFATVWPKRCFGAS
jgi:retron-type reverse transcriptase